RDAHRVRPGGARRARGRGGGLWVSREAVPRAGSPAGGHDRAGAARRARRAARGGGGGRRRARRAPGDRAREGVAHGEGRAHRGGRVRAAAQGEPGLRAPAEGRRGGGRRHVRVMSTTLTPPKERLRRSGGDTGLGGSWRVIVLNDNHNT